jgi:hypothetical protein
MTAKHPIPTRLREFVREAALEEDDEHVWVTVKLRCPRCSGTKFVLYWQHLREGGRIVETSPVWIACGACRYHALLFDDHCEGVNGLADEGPAVIPQCSVKPWDGAGQASYAVEVSVQYDKCPELYDEKGQLIPDAYDWLNVLAEHPDGSMDCVIEFETA